MARTRGWRFWATASAILAVAATVGLRLFAQPMSDVPLRARPGTCRAASKSIKLLAEIHNTRDGNFDCLGVDVSRGAIRALNIESHSFSDGASLDASERVKTVEIPVADIERREGVVLDGAPGHDAIVLRGRFSADRDRADLETSFLYNGFTGEYRSCLVKIDGGKDGWRLLDRSDRPIRRIVIRTRQLPLVGTVGIANLDGICD